VGDLLPADQAESVSIGGVEVIFRMSGEETDGAYELIEFRLQPGRLIPPHTHAREQEVSYVLEGEIGVRIGPDELTATQGSLVVKRPQVTHAWWNAGASPGRVLETISPAGLESYFRELADIHASRGFRDPGLVADLQDLYGIRANVDWIAALKDRHRLKLLGE
jgi:quercetin dioxygenase-like cupin family protein